jgi:type I phosphodiesterase/nucleotide pyrophosphatase
MVPDTDDRGAQVDELRQRLRTLGYLDAGVDRFVLAPAHGGRSATVIGLLASARIGLLGALILGPAAALAIAVRLPGLVVSLRDAVVLALYAAALFGLAIAAAALAASLLVSLAARRAGSSLVRHGRWVSIGVGCVVGLASLAYLTVLWTIWASPAPSHALAFSLAGLALAAGFSLLLGHAVMVTALALIVARTGAPPSTTGVPGASWRVMLAAAVLAFGGSVLLFSRSARLMPEVQEAPALTVVPSGLRIRVIAIDGFDPALFEKLSAAGGLPYLTQAFGTATARLELDDMEAGTGRRRDPARTWTTIATGQPASVHGVQTLETRRVAGVQGSISGGETSRAGRAVRVLTDLLRLTRSAVASGNERRVKTFWEVAADAGLRTAVVNWWATWPAAAGHGVVLTDRATLRLEHGGTLDGEIAPPELYDQLRRGWSALRDRARRASDDALRGSAAEGDVAALLHRSAELDAISLALASAVSSPATDLLVIYLPGLDIAQHALLDPGPGGVPLPSAMAARLAALDDYYVALDRLLDAAVRPAEQEMVVLVTAPGRVAAAASGLVGMSGGAAQKGSLYLAKATDIAPTILYALGIPISSELAGRPLAGLFTPAFTVRYGPREVRTYGSPKLPRLEGVGQPLDTEMIERLRSLGYVR